MYLISRYKYYYLYSFFSMSYAHFLKSYIATLKGDFPKCLLKSMVMGIALTPQAEKRNAALLATVYLRSTYPVVFCLLLAIVIYLSSLAGLSFFAGFCWPLPGLPALLSQNFHAL